jgi:hypothetical protein
MFEKKEKQRCLLLTRNRRVKEVSFPIEDNCFFEQSHLRGWGQTPYTLIRKKDTNNFYQVITDISHLPIALDGKQPQPQQRRAIEHIASEALDREEANVDKKAKKQNALWFIGTIALALTLLIVVMVIAGLIQSDSLSISAPDMNSVGNYFKDLSPS